MEQGFWLKVKKYNDLGMGENLGFTVSAGCGLLRKIDKFSGYFSKDISSDDALFTV